MYLVDTNVLSVGAPGRVGRSTTLIDWTETHSSMLFLSVVTVAEIADGVAKLNSSMLFLSVVTVAEIADGVAKLKRTGSATRAAAIGDWLQLVLHLYGSRMLAFDVAAARLAGELTDKARAAGQAPGFADIAIAATAESHGLTILTRNLRHFIPLGIPAIDPFAALPRS